MWLHITYYRFVDLNDLDSLKAKIFSFCDERKIKGTVLLANEGINSSMAGKPEAIREYMDFLQSIPAFKGIIFKETVSDTQPFKRLFVKIKKEIVTMGKPEISPAKFTCPNLPPKDLANWIEAGKEFLLLDTRNDYEVKLGTFQNAHDLSIDHFRQFPEKARELLPEWQNKPIVAFCTGGIRCEKATPWLQHIGFKEVYQLEGGILNYFKETGGKYWNGECFVFDNRIAVKGDLSESGAWICPDCEFAFPKHVHSCPNCA